jgi:hypothetical protein
MTARAKDDQEMEGRGGSKDRQFGVSRRGRQGLFYFLLLGFWISDLEICWTLESDANWFDTI